MNIKFKDIAKKQTMINSIKENITLAVPYSIFISSCYLFGYWMSFNIDFYSYISVTELAIYSIFPLFSVGVLSVIGFIVGRTAAKCESEKNNSCTNKATIKPYIVLTALLCILFALSFIMKSTIWLAVMVLTLLPTLYFVNKYTDSATFSRSSVCLLVMLPIIIHFSGRFNASRIINGEDFVFINNSFTNNYHANTKELDERYIGKIGEFIFVYKNSNNSVIIQNIKNIEKFELCRHNMFAKKLKNNK